MKQGKSPERIIKIKPFMNKFKWERTHFVHHNDCSSQDDWKRLKKNNGTIPLNVLYAKKKKHILLMFQNITQIVKDNLIF